MSAIVKVSIAKHKLYYIKHFQKIYLFVLTAGIFVIANPILAKAQTDTLTGYSASSANEHFIRINYDNDFFSATDRYYTQGIYFDFIAPFLKKSPLSKLLLPLPKTNLNYYGVTFRQDCFTPRSIRHDSIYEGERPYAGVIYISSFLTSINFQKKQRFTTAIDIGLIGPGAKAAETQKTIHRWLNNIQPLGWQYQIAQDYVLNYSAKFEQEIIAKKNVELTGILAARAGTVYDDASAGLLIRSGLMPSYFEHLGLQSTTTQASNNRPFQCFIIAKGEVKSVFYNATLQGGMFNKNSSYVLPNEAINRLVAIGNLGIVLAYKRLSLEYTKVYLTPEFKGGLSHSWGHCNITICF